MEFIIAVLMVWVVLWCFKLCFNMVLLLHEQTGELDENRYKIINENFSSKFEQDTKINKIKSKIYSYDTELQSFWSAFSLIKSSTNYIDFIKKNINVLITLPPASTFPVAGIQNNKNFFHFVSMNDQDRNLWEMRVPKVDDKLFLDTLDEVATSEYRFGIYSGEEFSRKVEVIKLYHEFKQNEKKFEDFLKQEVKAKILKEEILKEISPQQAIVVSAKKRKM